MAHLIRSIKRFSKKPATEITPMPDSLRTIDESTEINSGLLPLPAAVISLRSSGSKISSKEKKSENGDSEGKKCWCEGSVT